MADLSSVGEWPTCCHPGSERGEIELTGGTIEESLSHARVVGAARQGQDLAYGLPARGWGHKGSIPAKYMLLIR